MSVPAGCKKLPARTEAYGVYTSTGRPVAQGRRGGLMVCSNTGRWYHLSNKQKLKVAKRSRARGRGRGRGVASVCNSKPKTKAKSKSKPKTPPSKRRRTSSKPKAKTKAKPPIKRRRTNSKHKPQAKAKAKAHPKPKNQPKSKPKRRSVGVDVYVVTVSTVKVSGGSLQVSGSWGSDEYLRELIRVTQGVPLTTTRGLSTASLAAYLPDLPYELPPQFKRLKTLEELKRMFTPGGCHMNHERLLKLGQAIYGKKVYTQVPTRDLSRYFKQESAYPLSTRLLCQYGEFLLAHRLQGHARPPQVKNMPEEGLASTLGGRSSFFAHWYLMDFLGAGVDAFTLRMGYREDGQQGCFALRFASPLGKIRTTALINPHKESVVADAMHARGLGPRTYSHKVKFPSGWNQKPRYATTRMEVLHESFETFLVDLQARRTNHELSAAAFRKKLKLLQQSLKQMFQSLHDQRVVHGDLHASNLMFKARSNKLYLIDFGRSCVLPASLKNWRAYLEIDYLAMVKAFNNLVEEGKLGEELYVALIDVVDASSRQWLGHEVDLDTDSFEPLDELERNLEYKRLVKCTHK